MRVLLFFGLFIHLTASAFEGVRNPHVLFLGLPENATEAQVKEALNVYGGHYDQFSKKIKDAGEALRAELKSEERNGIYLSPDDVSGRNIPCADCPKITSLVSTINNIVQKIADDKESSVNKKLLREVEVLQALYHFTISEDSKGRITCEQRAIVWEPEVTEPYKSEDLLLVFEEKINAAKLEAISFKGTKEKSIFLRGRGEQKDIVIRVDIDDKGVAKISYYRMRGIEVEKAPIQVPHERPETEEEKIDRLRREIKGSVAKKRESPLVGGYYEADLTDDGKGRYGYGLLFDASNPRKAKIKILDYSHQRVDESGDSVTRDARVTHKEIAYATRTDAYSGMGYGASVSLTKDTLRTSIDFTSDKTLGSFTLYSEKGKNDNKVGVIVPSRFSLFDYTVQGKTQLDNSAISTTHSILGAQGKLTLSKSFDSGASSILITRPLVNRFGASDTSFSDKATVGVRFTRTPFPDGKGSDAVWLEYRVYPGFFGK